MIYVFWSCGSQLEAKTIIHQLLDKRLIACASILPQVESIYRWKGKIEESIEVKVILKTLPQHFETIRKTIQTQSSYAVPEILQIDIVQGNPDYLAWVVQETL